MIFSSWPTGFRPNLETNGIRKSRKTLRLGGSTILLSGLWQNSVRERRPLSRPMKSKAASSFWKSYDLLPSEIQKTAVKQYRLWLRDHRHSSVQFKKVQEYWSARVTDHYRALG